MNALRSSTEKPYMRAILTDSSSDQDTSTVNNPPRLKANKRRRENDINMPTTTYFESYQNEVLPRSIPRSISPDVRYTYSGLLAHVYNSCDYDLMYQFLSTYYRQDFVLQQELTGNFPEALKGLVEVRGRTLAGKYWYERMHDSPDVIFTIQHVDIDMNEESMCGTIRCKFNLRGSQIINALDPEFNPSLVTKDPTNMVTYVQEEAVEKYAPKSNIDKEDFDTILDGAKEIDFGFKEISSSSFTESNFLPEEQSDSFALNPVNQFYFNVSDVLQRKDEFAGLKVPRLEAKPVLVMNKVPIQQKHLITVNYSHDGSVEMHFDGDSLIYYSKFVLSNA